MTRYVRHNSNSKTRPRQGHVHIVRRQAPCCHSALTFPSCSAFALGIARSVGFDKWLLAYVLHYTILQNSFKALNSPVFHLPLSPPLIPLAITDLLLCPHGQCNGAGVLQDVAFAGCLPHSAIRIQGSSKSSCSYV